MRYGIPGEIIYEINIDDIPMMTQMNLIMRRVSLDVHRGVYCHPHRRNYKRDSLRIWERSRDIQNGKW